MFAATAITVVGIILARKAYTKMTLKEGRLGDKGDEGPRGDDGAISPILNSPGEIAYQQLLLHCETELEKIKRARNLPFEDGEIHLKNMNFKDHIKRISHSAEFKNEILKLLRCKLGCKTPEEIKETYCRSKTRFMAFILAKVKQDLSEWIKRMCIYKKGLVYLSQEMSIEKDWGTLYLTVDKELGLYPNPHDHFKSLSFNWGCDNKSNFTDCESCPKPTTTTTTTEGNSTSVGSQSNSETESFIYKQPGCSVTRDDINNILKDAFTPDRSTVKTRSSGDGNYTWNWGAV